jgi:hypothetical protein
VLVDLGDGDDGALHVTRHLAQRLQLLLGGGGDALGRCRELLGQLADPAHGLARLEGVGDAVAVVAGRVDGLAQRVEVRAGGGHHGGDAARLRLAVGGELADLVGHDAEGGAVGAGAGGLDGRVEGQKLGLVGHLLDHAGEGGDLGELVGEALDALALGAHGLDRLHDPREDRRAALDLGREVGAHARGLLAGARRALRAAVQGLDGDRHALELVADVMHARGHRRGAHGGASAAAAEGEHGAVDAADHAGDGTGQLGQLIGGIGIAPRRGRGEVPGGVVRFDLRCDRQGGVQHGAFIGQKWAQV